MSDMAERIRNRSQRPTVPERPTALADESDTPLSETQNETPKRKTRKVSKPKADLVEFSESRRLARLELQIDEQVASLCSKHRINFDVLVEALFEVADEHKLIELACQRAQERIKRRRASSQVRRARTLAQSLEQED